MAERTPAADSEIVEKIAPDRTQEIDTILSAETPPYSTKIEAPLQQHCCSNVAAMLQQFLCCSEPVVTEDGSKNKNRVKRDIYTTLERNDEIEKDGKKYRLDQKGQWKRVFH